MIIIFKLNLEVSAFQISHYFSCYLRENSSTKLALNVLIYVIFFDKNARQDKNARLAGK